MMLGGDLFFGYQLFQTVMNTRNTAVDKLLVDVSQKNPVARNQGYFSNSMAHVAGADNRYGPNVVNTHCFLLRRK